MKKLFTVFAIAATLVACNDSADSTTVKDSSSTLTVDTNTTVTPVTPVDTTRTGDSIKGTTTTMDTVKH
jgi:hypothetical protein